LFDNEIRHGQTLPLGKSSLLTSAFARSVYRPIFVTRILEIIVKFSATGLLIGAILMLVAGSFPVIEVTTNFRPHLLVIGVGVVIVAAWVSRPMASVAIVAVLALAPSTLPYLFGADIASAAAGSEELTVLQYNTLYTNHDIDGIAEEILSSDADIVALHEMTNDRWNQLQPQISDVYPHQVSNGNLRASRGFASVLLSRTPLRPVQDVPDIAPVAATTTIDDRDVLAIALHPSPSRTESAKIDHRRDLLDATVDFVEQHGGPAIIITDLNIAPTSPDYQGFIDDLGWDDPRRSLGIAPTFPTGPLNPIGIAIDHVFASPELIVTNYELGDGGGSDHRSLVARLAAS